MNLEKREYNRIYRIKKLSQDPGYYKNYNTLWKEKNPYYYRIYSQCYRLKHKNYFNKYQKEWRSKNKHKIKVWRINNKENIRRSIDTWQKNNKHKIKEYSKEYYQKHRNKLLNKQKDYSYRVLGSKPRTKKIVNIKEYYKHYQKRPEYKKKKKEYYKINIEKINKKANTRAKLRKKIDPSFLISCRLRCLLCNAIRLYSQQRKTMSSKKYGVDYKEIIEHLKPFPEDLSKYHIDHIRPLCSFDLTDPEQVKLAFAPENIQWLLAEENLKKGGRLL